MARPRVTVKYNGKQLTKDLNKEFKRRLIKCGEMVASEVRRNISISTRANGASAPGEFPHADTGTLRKSISYSVDSDTRGRYTEVEIGSVVEYADHLEEGTGRMDARPYLEPTVRNLMPRLRGIMLAPVKDSDLGTAYVSARKR